jgi:GMP synthase (glutamine-hydrolysing)
MTRLLAICHPGGGTSGVFHAGAREAGCVIEEWTPAEALDPPRPLDEYAGLIVLGGDQNVCEQDRYPYLTGELSLLRRWLPSGRPMLGVCLGAQLLAEAAGGRVVRARRRELGWLDVDLLPAAGSDPVLGFAPSRVTALQWHSYAVEPPTGATVLASSPVCAQAYRLGEAWGVQFHPEVDTAILGAWLMDLDPGVPEQARDAHILAAGVPENLDDWNAFGHELLRRFAARLHPIAQIG